MDAFELFQFALLAGAAIVGIAVGVLHMYGWVPPRYRRMLAEVQRSTADTIAASIKAEADSFSAGIPDLPAKIQAALHAELAPLAEGLSPLARGMEALPLSMKSAVAEAVQPLQEGIGNAVANGFGAVIAELGASAQGASIQPAATNARITNSLAKQGAKKLLASMAASVHPALGLAIPAAGALGLLDDNTAEQIATFLIDNPELMAQINSAGQRVAQSRGITVQGSPTSGVARTLAGAER